MNILCVHNRYLYRGGEDESSELENSLLRANGHNVVEHVVDNQQIGEQFLLGVGLRSIWNPASYARIRRTIREKDVELVKIDNFFPQISPAVFYAAGVEGVPTIQALRNFRILCPGATFFRDGKVCEDCVGRALPWPGLLHGCYRKSRAQTLAPAAMSTLHRLAGTWRSRVSAYVALSDFSRKKFIQGGLPSDKIFVKPNFVEDFGIGDGNSRTALFVGRLSAEKGIDVLISAWSRIGSKLKLRIVGTGPLERAVRDSVAANPAIEYLGARPLSETYDLMGSAMVLIFPSNWYETFGRAVAESFAKGTPVIAAKLGTMTTMVAHRSTGLHFESGNPASLVEQVEWMLDHQEQWCAMRKAAREAYQKLYTPERNYQMMMRIYETVIAKSRERRHGVRAVTQPLHPKSK